MQISTLATAIQSAYSQPTPLPAWRAEGVAIQQQVALTLLKQSMEFEGQLALQLLPGTAAAAVLQPLNAASSPGQTIDIHV